MLWGGLYYVPLALGRDLSFFLKPCPLFLSAFHTLNSQGLCVEGFSNLGLIAKP